MVDTLTGLAFESAAASQGSCAASTTAPVKVTCTLGTVAAGGTATVTLRARPTAATTALRNTAYATATLTADPSPNNAKATATTRVVAPAGKIAFTSMRAGKAEIYAMNADGTGRARLTTNAAEDKAAGLVSGDPAQELRGVPWLLSKGEPRLISGNSKPIATRNGVA